MSNFNKTKKSIKLLILIIICVHALVLIYWGISRPTSSIFKTPEKIEFIENKEKGGGEEIEVQQEKEEKMDYIDEEILIWYDNRELMNWWFRNEAAKEKAFNKIVDCPLVKLCRATLMEEEEENADIVVQMAAVPRRAKKRKLKNPNAVSVVSITEQDKLESCPNFVKNNDFDFRVSYSSYADVWAPLECKSAREMLNGETQEFYEGFLNRPGDIVAVISNCGAQPRKKWIVEMMEAGLKIDHYGNCWKNKDGGVKGVDWQKQKRQLIQKYKFLISFENHKEFDYVTEKAFDAYESGCIPIYFGAPNVDDFLPPGSFVDVRKYDSPQDLAQYLIELLKKPEEMIKFVNWDVEEFSKTLIGQSCSYDWKCRVCHRVAKERRENRTESNCIDDQSNTVINRRE